MRVNSEAETRSLGFHRQRAYRKRYGQAAPVFDLAEEQALKWAQPTPLK